MNKLDKWAAEQCGLIEGEQTNYLFYSNKYRELGEISGFTTKTWTLSDPRCMQVFREKFKLSTKHNPEGWLCVQYQWAKRGDGHVCLNGRGKTIQEAELNCAQAIYEASNDK